MSAFQLSPCWRNPDGQVGSPGGGPTAEDDAEIGSISLLVPYSTITGERIGPGVEQCSLDPTPPPLPPPPPTAIELWQAAGLPQPAIEVSPPGTGLVGFEAWFWSNVDQAPVTVTVTLRGWTATVTAAPEEYLWDPGDGTAALHNPNPGTAEDPAARHAYRSHGTYQVRHTVVWRGTFSLTGYGITVNSESLGTVRPSGTAAYPVDERQAVIVG